MAMIFVVDDTLACRNPMARLLRAQGYEITCAENGQEALKALALATPSLILLDLAMPIMDGLTFLKILRETPEWANVPVIVVSGESLEGGLKSAEALGATEVLMKGTYEVAALMESIKRHLND